MTRARGEQVIVQRVSRDHSGIRLVLKTRFFCERNNLILQYYPWGFTSIHSIARLYRQKYNLVFGIFYFKIRNFETHFPCDFSKTYLANSIGGKMADHILEITRLWDFNFNFLCEKLLGLSLRKKRLDYFIGW